MPLDVRQFNWLDIVVIIIFVRTVYIAVKNGFPVEIFKLAGTVFSIYVSLHYYTGLSDAFTNKLISNIFPVEFIDFISFLILTILGYFVFFVLRWIFFRFVKIETISMLNRWGGAFTGSIRALLLISLVMYGLMISSVSYLHDSVKRSYFGKPAFKFAPAVYSGMWNGILSKFITQEKLNPAIGEVEKILNE